MIKDIISDLDKRITQLQKSKLYVVSQEEVWCIDSVILELKDWRGKLKNKYNCGQS